ncbi:19998_t:CDS:2, partial [Gigaspora rosea]
IVVGGLRLSLVDLDCCWWVKVYVAFGGLWWVEVVFGEFRLLLVGLRCFWWVEVVFGEFRLLLVGLRCFWWVLVGLRRNWYCRSLLKPLIRHKLLHFPYLGSTGPGEGIGYVLSLRVKTYELAVLGGRKGKGG